MKTEYTYDKANRITAVSTPLGVQSVFYDFAGRVVKSANNATGAEKLIEYDGRGLISHIKTVADGKTIFEENNTYDKLGNKTISVENGITTKYRYDGMNRLTSVIKGENETVYDFDCYNNIEKKYELFLDNKSITRYHYDSANRLVMSENGTNAVHYEYDDSGNMTKKTDNNGPIRYSYDGFNRLKSVAFGENVTEYAYTPEGFRSKKTVNGSTTRYLYDGANICAEVIPDGTSYTYYRADGIIGSVHGDEKLYYSQTSRGDVSVVYDTAGNVVKSNTYSPYGERKTVQKVNDTNDPLRLMWVAETENVHIPFGYCGEYTDDETGFVYLRNRYYDPEVGRFITEDPIRNGVNWYVYAGNNPVNFVDPWGLAVTRWDRENLLPKELKQIIENDKIWAEGNAREKKDAEQSSYNIRKRHLSENQQILDNGYVVETLRIPGGGETSNLVVKVKSCTVIERIYTEKIIYASVKSVEVQVDTDSGFKVDELYVRTGQSAPRSVKKIEEWSGAKKYYSFAPSWGSVFDDGGAGNTVIGSYIKVTVSRPNSEKKYTLQVFNQLYCNEYADENGQIHLKPDLSAILEEALARGVRE